MLTTLSWSAATVFMPNTRKPEERVFCQMTVKVIQSALEIMKSRHFVKLDGQLGNFSCEVLAWMLHQAATSSEFQEECSALEAKIQEIASRNFTLKDLEEIPLSEEMASLLRARLLSIVKKVFYDKEGYLTEKTDRKRLGQFCQIALTSNQEKEIVLAAQKALSESGVLFMRQQVKLIEDLSPDEREIFEAIFDEKNVRIFERLSYSCLLYRVKTIVHLAKQNQVILAFTSMAKKEERAQTIFYQRRGLGFERLSPEEVDKSKCVVVFEGFLRTSEDQLAEEIERQGLLNFVISQVAIEGQQFEKGKTVVGFEGIQDEELRQRIESRILPLLEQGWRNKAIFDFVHVYLNSIEDEMEPDEARRIPAEV